MTSKTGQHTETFDQFQRSTLSPVAYNPSQIWSAAKYDTLTALLTEKNSNCMEQ